MRNTLLRMKQTNRNKVKSSTLEIHIDNFFGDPISPDQFDIVNLKTLIDIIEPILSTGMKDRPLISYSVSDGSVRNLFKTSIQTVTVIAALLSLANEAKSLDLLDFQVAKQLSEFQKLASNKKWKIDIIPHTDLASTLSITPDTKYTLRDEIWVDTELYIYGIVKDFGGKTKPNIHIDTDNLGYVKISAPKDMLENYEKNPFNKQIGIRASVKQSIETGEIDRDSFELLEFIDYHPNNTDITKNIDEATKTWEGIDPDAWLDEIRGRNEH